MLSIDDLATLRRIVDEIKQREIQHQARHLGTKPEDDFSTAAQGDVPRLVTYIERLLAEAEASSMAARRQLLDRLRELQRAGQNDLAHLEADEALLRYIADEEITQAFLNVRR